MVASDDGREKMRRLKEENRNLRGLLRETEDRFKSKLDQSRKESENLTKIFKQILPVLKQALGQQQSTDMNELVRILEMSAASDGGSTPSNGGTLTSAEKSNI
mmetsp:Transcript_24530/g.24125  ORF Transcript_24530/g.24125 Transcript_24530/m.24125 type:complete len:103 (-) Transcript_24530:445-753(-)